MVESVSFTRLPVPLAISMGNLTHLLGKWKQQFAIYRKGIGATKKPDEPCLESYSNFIFLPECDDPTGGEDKLPAENSDNYATIMAKFDEYFQKREPQLMLCQKFWVHLKREPTQTIDSWIVTVKERTL